MVEIVTLRQKPYLKEQVLRLNQEAWPAFLQHDNARHWESFYDRFDGYQVLACDPEDTVVAVGHTVPFAWDSDPGSLPETLECLRARVEGAHRDGVQPTSLSATAVIVAQSHQGRGLSTVLLKEMKGLAALHNLDALVSPIRPFLKAQYPLTPMKRYVEWRREDGSPFDPWLRVHWRLGARQLRVLPRAATATGSVSQWESWTGMQFPGSGDYIVPGAFQPVSIDLDQDLGLYEEPSVWILHPVR